MGIWSGFQRLFGRKADDETGEKKFEYVYVNQDGTARELSLDERNYLSEDFHSGDSGRPYIKRSYTAVDGWGSLSGFLPRRKLPQSVTVRPVSPDYSMARALDLADFADDERRDRDFEAIRRTHLERRRAQEQAASHPNSA